MLNNGLKMLHIAVLLMCGVMLAGCGGGTNTDGKGNTVYLTAYSKTGTSTGVATTSATMAADAVFSYTVLSTAYTGVTPSAAVITGATISFTQLSGPATVPIAPWHAPLSISLPAAGSAYWDNVPVISATPVYPAAIGQYHYKASVQFTAKEDTGQNITCNPVDTNIFVTPVLGTIFFNTSGTPTPNPASVTIIGGTSPYTLTSTGTGLTASIAGNTITIGLAAAPGATQQSETITVTDSLNKVGYINVSYY